MAKELTVIAKAIDASSAPLKRVQNSLSNTGKSAKRAALDFTEFNRIMFSTTAFIGLFTGAFRSLGSAVTEGARVDRVSDQFARVLGPKGEFFNLIGNLTDNTIDRMEAMRAGISLRSLGIAKDMGQVAGIVSQAGTAAKLAGKDSGEGIKHYTEFLKTGSISQLSFLNIIAETNPALQAQLAILHKAGGPMGKVLSQQHRLALGANLLRTTTEKHLKGERDLLDVIQDVSQAFSLFRAEIGKFIGTALSPIIEKISKAVYTFTDLLERTRTTSKEFITFTKNLLVAGTSITSMLATLGTARLIFKGLASIGIGGIPLVVLSVMGLATAFSDLDKSVDRIFKGFKLLGSGAMGVLQLMSSFLNNTENATNGIGKMDAALYKMLKEEGLLGFVNNLARAGIIAVEFGRSVVDGVSYAVEFFKNDFAFILDPLQELLGMDGGAWSKDIIKNVKSVAEWVGYLGTIVAGGLAIFGGLKLGKSLLGRLPIIGKFFGGGRGGSGGPKGTSGDPLYVQAVDKLTSIRGISDRILQNKTLGEIATHPEGKMAGLMEVLKTSMSTLLGFLLSPFKTLGAIGKDVANALRGVGNASIATKAGLLGLAGIAGFALGKQLGETAVGGAIGDFIGTAIDKTAGFFGISGSTADQQRIAALQNTPAYKQLMIAGLQAGETPMSGEALSLTESVASQFPQTQEFAIAQARRGLFERKFANFSKIGLSSDGTRVTHQPEILPTAENFRIEQIKRVMQMVNEDVSSRMQKMFNQVMEDNKFSKEEMIMVYKEGIDASELAKNSKKEPSAPNLAAARLKKGC